MKSAVLTKFDHPFELQERPIPAPAQGEVLIRVRASGLCGTDLHIREGKIPTVKLPRVPGHETAGEIAGVGPGVTDFQVGDHVIVSIDRVCGECRYCRSGRENICQNLVRNGFEADGGHSEYMVAPQGCVLKIAKDMPFEQAAILPDAVGCMVHAIYDQAQVQPGDEVCILGMGGLGFQAVQILKHIGANTIVTSRQDAKLDLSREYGADGCVNTAKENLTEAVRKLTNGRMCDVVLDNIGNEDSIQQALDILAPGGRAIIVGYAVPKFHVNYQDTMMREKEILGMRGSTRKNLIKAIELVETGAIKPYVHTTMPFEQINEAMEMLASGKALGRIVLTMK